MLSAKNLAFMAAVCVAGVIVLGQTTATQTAAKEMLLPGSRVASSEAAKQLDLIFLAKVEKLVRLQPSGPGRNLCDVDLTISKVMKGILDDKTLKIELAIQSIPTGEKWPIVGETYVFFLKVHHQRSYSFIKLLPGDDEKMVANLISETATASKPAQGE